LRVSEKEGLAVRGKMVANKRGIKGGEGGSSRKCTLARK